MREHRARFACDLLLGGCGAGCTVFEEGNQLFGIVGGRETGVAGADDGEGFVGGEMGQSFFEGAG